jgi:hypothetical protein
LLEKLVPTFAVRWCHVVKVTDSRFSRPGILPIGEYKFSCDFPTLRNMFVDFHRLKLEANMETFNINGQK